MATTTRTARIDDATWDAAQRTAEEQGVTMTDVWRDALRAFIRQHSDERLVPHHDPVEGNVGVDLWTLEPNDSGGGTAFAYRQRADGSYAKVLRVITLTAGQVDALRRT